jgi:predicted HAD superfamily Cof-like phosphohydrolase
MLTNAEKVEEFMITYGQLPSHMGLGEAVALGRRLVEEELDEADEALALENPKDRRVGLFDAGLDVLYFAYGNMLREGFSVNQIMLGFAEVHASNMSKLDENGKPIFREDGKVLKGPNYFKPDLAKVLCI